MRESVRQGTGAETKVFHFSEPLLALVSTWLSPLERLSWCHLGQADPPYCGGGGGGGGSVNSRVMATLAFPAAPASMASVAERFPANAEVATETWRTCVTAAPSEAVECGANDTAASSAVPVHASGCPPMLLTVTLWAGGIWPASALNESASGVTASCAGGGGGGGTAVKPMETATVTLPAEPASKVRVALRAPAAAWAATLMETVDPAPAASEPVAGDNATAGSDEVAVQVRLEPPSLSTESDCAAGAAGACAANDSDGGATTRLPGAGGGDGGGGGSYSPVSTTASGEWSLSLET